MLRFNELGVHLYTSPINGCDQAAVTSSTMMYGHQIFSTSIY